MCLNIYVNMFKLMIYFMNVSFVYTLYGQFGNEEQASLRRSLLTLFIHLFAIIYSRTLIR